MRQGQVRWEVMILDGNIHWWEWVCRTIRGGRAYFIIKCSLTWGKLSKKHGDFGWLKSIPSNCRISCPAQKTNSRYDQVRGQLFTTKAAAVRAETRRLKSNLREGGELEPHEWSDHGGKSLSDQIKQLERWLIHHKRKVRA